MTDIVERLRAPLGIMQCVEIGITGMSDTVRRHWLVALEAADEITRLRAENERLKASLTDTVTQTQEQAAENEKLRTALLETARIVASEDDCENERLEAENERMRNVLTMIAENRGQCGECGRDAVGDGEGVVHCVDERPDWHLYRSRCWWEPGDPVRRARAALEEKR